MGLEVQRVGEHEFVGRNERGAEVRLGRKGAEGAFSPAELLQVAAAGCSAVTAENLITRRVGEDAKFRVDVTADRREGASELDAVHLKFDVDVSGLGQDEREALALAVDRAIDKLCTVSRTLKKGIPVTEELPI
ncbi:OsmC family protein [Amycolatopsis acidiphila]|uniref:OsmC family protein n=1 Tax=Amycolatopsis acidiphila TaxID=715473 RepID=A0A558A9R4_9PSEU|nr:OsmC family protein [Amycolatopsis acidiphila]TVT20999.1 OsmC family protein [Amycolatopsis acidiphila]UIJ61340.1 OsmC family protein [Amycolatopsis acidiphila]GHG78127.1 osmotically inducible protein C [Amycolatopsis acidiphila]